MPNITDNVSDGHVAEFPLQAAVNIFNGAVVSVAEQHLANDVRGHVVAATTVAGHRVIGVARDEKDNTGGLAGALRINVLHNGPAVRMTIDTGTVSDEDIGAPVYVSGVLGTVFSRTVGAILLGTIDAIDPESTTRAFIKLVDYPDAIGVNAQVLLPDATEVVTNLILAESTKVVVGTVVNDADDFIVLPALSRVPAGHKITCLNNAGGAFEARTPAASNETINNVDADGTNELLMTDTQVTTFVSQVTNWVAYSHTNLGAVAAAVVPN